MRIAVILWFSLNFFPTIFTFSSSFSHTYGSFFKFCIFLKLSPILPQLWFPSVKNTLACSEVFFRKAKGTLNADFSGTEGCRQLNFLSEFYRSPNLYLHAKVSFTGELFLPSTTFKSAKFGRFSIFWPHLYHFILLHTSLSLRSSAV